MAIGPAKQGSSQNAANVTQPSSIKSQWDIINSDATAANDADEKVAPYLIDKAGFHWVRVPDAAARVELMARWSTGGTITTNPVVKLLGVNLQNSDKLDGNSVSGTSETDTNFGIPRRLDTTDSDGGGITLTMQASASNANVFRDAIWDYSDITATAYDCRCVHYIGVLIDTAAAGPSSVQIMCNFLN